MAWAYFDTSALVKRYIREPRSLQVGALLRRYDFVSSAITPVIRFTQAQARGRSVRGEFCRAGAQGSAGSQGIGVRPNTHITLANSVEAGPNVSMVLVHVWQLPICSLTSLAAATQTFAFDYV